ncbi:hypothetical protein RJ639_040870, partial [Escallonia herrerae]
GYVVMQEKLPNYVVPDLTDFKVFALKSHVLLACEEGNHVPSYQGYLCCLGSCFHGLEYQRRT